MGKLPDKPAVVYAIRCSKTGRIYIGCTSALEQRIKTHFRELKNRDKRAYGDSHNKGYKGCYADNSLWQKDYDKYGRDAFDVFVLEENVPKEDRARRENYWIDKYKAIDPKYGYNLHVALKESPIRIMPGLPPLPEEKKDEGEE